MSREVHVVRVPEVTHVIVARSSISTNEEVKSGVVEVAAMADITSVEIIGTNPLIIETISIITLPPSPEAHAINNIVFIIFIVFCIIIFIVVTFN